MGDERPRSRRAIAETGVIGRDPELAAVRSFVTRPVVPGAMLLFSE
jgi:hypothetical protein